MNQVLCATLASLLLAGGLHAQTSTQAGSPLLQVELLSGDQYVGFTQSCLLVYSDGTYHREVTQQRHVDERPDGHWESPEVFEGTIDSANLEQLKEIIESENFRRINEAVVEPQALFSRLRFRPAGPVPHQDVKIFEASVAHSTGPQVFEISDSGTRDTENSLKPFRKWIAAVTKSNQGRTDAANATSCAVSKSGLNRSPWIPTTILIPRPLSTPAPTYPPGQSNGNVSESVMVHLIINTDGRVGAAVVKRGINPTLNQCALETVRQWTFLPARLAGVAIAMPLDVEMRFQLESKHETY